MINHMTFVVSLVASFAPWHRSGANVATRATNKLYALQKSCNCLILETSAKGVHGMTVVLCICHKV